MPFWAQAVSTANDGPPPFLLGLGAVLLVLFFGALLRGKPKAAPSDAPPSRPSPSAPRRRRWVDDDNDDDDDD